MFCVPVFQKSSIPVFQSRLSLTLRHAHCPLRTSIQCSKKRFHSIEISIFQVQDHTMFKKGFTKFWKYRDFSPPVCPCWRHWNFNKYWNNIVHVFSCVKERIKEAIQMLSGINQNAGRNAFPLKRNRLSALEQMQFKFPSSIRLLFQCEEGCQGLSSFLLCKLSVVTI